MDLTKIFVFKLMTVGRILARTGTPLIVLFHPHHLRVCLVWRLVGTQTCHW